MIGYRPNGTVYMRLPVEARYAGHAVLMCGDAGSVYGRSRKGRARYCAQAGNDWGECGVIGSARDHPGGSEIPIYASPEALR